MQDRYVGDVGDFGKYGLLRALTVDRSLGVVWYLTPDEGHNADGKHVSYLVPSATNRAKYRDCDPGLYDALGGIVSSGTRSVKGVRERGILPTGTVFYDKVLTYAGMSSIGPGARNARLVHRRRWVEQALDTTQHCDIVFLDPDNGIGSGTKRHESTGPKYVYFDEVQPYLSRGQSVVVYHHLHFGAPALDQVAHLFARVGDRLKGYGRLHALLYCRGTLRVFLVIPARGYEAILTGRSRHFMAGPWSQHFKYLTI